MSGIAGIVRLDGGPVDRALLEKMADFQGFRGPHGRGVWCDGNVGFVHTLFKLNDDDAPTPQPLTLDGKVWITAHARVDAQDELIAALRGRGREVAKGVSDSELLLHAYHAWGECCLEHVIGDFTFAIWDGREQRLFCAVDHFGIRPFFYAHIGDTLVFSNTLDCVRLIPAIPDNLNDLAIGDFVLFGRYQDLDQTIYAAIRRLPRAHALLASHHGIGIRRFWGMIEEEEVDDSDPNGLVDEFRSRLLIATRDRLRTRRVAVSMSGGLDSTLVTASIIQAMRERESSWRVAPFTTVFRSLSDDSEELFARATAEHLGLDLHVQQGDDLVPFDWVASYRWPLPEPPHDAAWTPYVRNISEARQSAELLFTGWEGDEPLRAFLPAWWRGLVRERRWRRLFSDIVWYIRKERGVPPVGARTAILRLKRWLGAKTLPDCFSPEFDRRVRLRERWATFRYAQADRYYKASRPRYLDGVPWANVFTSYDSAWIGLPIETAHPLMDLRVIVWLTRIPAIPWCVDKRLFRAAARGNLPGSIVSRPKTAISSDPTTAALKRSPVRLPDCIKALATDTGYFVADRLFDAQGNVKLSGTLEHTVRAISFLGWLNSRMRRNASPS